MYKERFTSAMLGVLLFIIVQPFGITHMGWMRWVMLASIIVVSIVVCISEEFILRYVLRMPNDTSRGQQYIIRRNIVFQLLNISFVPLCIAIDINLIKHFYEGTPIWSWEVYGYCVVLCLCASLYLGLYWRNVYAKRHYARELAEAQCLNGILQERARLYGINTPSEDKSPRIHIEGTTKESVELSATAFLYASSEGNYVSIHYLEGEETKQAVLRTSMKNVLTLLTEANGNIMQCHRAFIVNLRHVENVEGRSSGIGLNVRHCREVIPVSKAYVQEVKQRIQNPE